MTVLDDIDVADRATDEVVEDRPRRARGAVTGERATRSKAAQRAIDRRRKRIERDEPATAGRTRAVPTTARPTSLRTRITRIPFVVPVIALLVIGLGTSLWLSTKAAQDSYRLGVERQENQTLVDKRDSLKRDYESGDSAPELSDKATKLGMIPASNPPRMIVGPNGKPRLVGDPQPAQGKGMRTINPPVGPDPVEKIDPKKVDDSEGLPGGAVESATAQPDSNSATTPAPGAPTTPATAPTGAATPAPAAGDAGAVPQPAPSVIAPAPNVLPAQPQTNPTPNAPGANSGQSR
ncbi:hypothetical protein AAFP30_03620 [Gordonia sp. CPCC 205515]|uniref:hypothetical protein n=1 Tax=Gordonia sp. CPCC 205515 TaxID=3140791 RepID=UPI003AF35A94